jgi:hypothetical protein
MKKLFFLIIGVMLIQLGYSQCSNRECIWDASKSINIRVYAKFCEETQADLPRVLVEASNYNVDVNYKITYTIRWYNKSGEAVRTETSSLNVDKNTTYYDAGYNYYPSSQPSKSYNTYKIYDIKADVR